MHVYHRSALSGLSDFILEKAWCLAFYNFVRLVVLAGLNINLNPNFMLIWWSYGQFSHKLISQHLELFSHFSNILKLSTVSVTNDVLKWHFMFYGDILWLFCLRWLFLLLATFSRGLTRQWINYKISAQNISEARCLYELKETVSSDFNGWKCTTLFNITIVLKLV